MLSDIFAETIGKFVEDSIKSKSRWGWVIAGLVSAFCLAIAFISMTYKNAIVAIIFFILAMIPIYIRARNLTRK